MRRFHLWAGVLTVLVFLITGQFMRLHQPSMETFPADVRLMFRSRHIYILAGGLINLMLGLYLQREQGRRGIVQLIGSGLLIVSPVLLVVAFIVEPERGFHEQTWWSHLGLYALFAGCMLHLATRIVQRRLGTDAPDFIGHKSSGQRNRS